MVEVLPMTYKQDHQRLWATEKYEVINQAAPAPVLVLINVKTHVPVSL